MANATSAQLQELYVAYFGRAADPAGLDYWEDAGTTQKAFAGHMHAQAEFQDAYGSSSTENQVNQIYKNLFDREADAAGLSYWTSQINNGVLQLAEIANHLIYNVRATGGNADDLAALNNRRDAAVAYSAEVKASTSAMTAYQPLSTSPFSAGENFEEAKNYMLGIDKDTAHTAAGVTASVDVIEGNGTPAAKSTFALTDNVDNFTGGEGDDTFSGTKGQIDGDTFNGGRGNDTLTFTVDGRVASNTGDMNASFTSTLIETIKIRATGDTTLDFGDVTGTTGITVNRSSAALTLENIMEIDTITLDREDDDQIHTFVYKASVIGGQSDSITLNIENSSNVGLINVDGIETINLVSTSNPTNDANELSLNEEGTDIGTTTSTEVLNISGTGDLELTLTESITITNSASADVEILDANAATSVTHTGTGELDVTLGVQDDVTVTAADATGDLVVTADATNFDLTLTGGAGADTFEMGATLVYTDATNLDVIDGGAGIDTLQLTSSATTVTSVTDGDINVTNVEQVEINAATAADALDFDVFVSPTTFTTAIITSALDAAEVTLTDVQASTYTIRNAKTGTVADNLALAVVDLKSSSGTADTITINLDNRQLGTTNNQNNFTIAGLTAAGIEIATINATKASSEGTAEDITVTALTAVDLESLTLTGDADLVITNALDDECVTVNASAYTGALDLLHGTNALTYTGGTGADTIRFAADDLSTTDTITGGAGADTLIAVLDSGTITPTVSGVETVRVTLNGGNLNASSITGATNLEIAAGEAANTGTISNLATTVTEVTQLADAATVRFGYASAAAGTMTYNFTDDTAGAITNVATTIDNVANLTVAGDDGDSTIATAVDLGSLTGAAVTSLTVTTGSDADDTLDVGALDTDSLINLTTSASAASLTVGTLVDADDLATISITGTDGVAATSGITTIGAIGGTTAADALTSFTLNLSGGAEAHIGALTATDADITTFDIDLTGDYLTTTIGAVAADNITNLTIDTAAGTGSDEKLTITSFDIAETTGDLTFNTGDDFEIINAIAVATSVGDISVVATDTFISGDNAIWIDEATTVGNITLTASGSGNGINVGDLDEATTVGNITITANDDVEFDGADAATTIGNFVVSVDAGKTADLNDGTFGAASSTIGSITASGGGTFNITIGAASSLGDVDLSGMTSGSTSSVTLNNTTTSGITATLGSGADTFVGTGGADNITASIGADTITAGGGDDVIDLTEAVGSRSADTVVFSATAANGNDTITGFTVGANADTINVAALGGTATAVNGATLTDGDGATNATDNMAYVFDDGALGVGSTAITDYTNTTQVAAFLEAGLNITANDALVAVVNDLTTDKAYVYNVVDTGNTTIVAGEVTLHGTISIDTADAVFIHSNVVVA